MHRAFHAPGRLRVTDVSLAEAWFRDRTVDPDFDPAETGHDGGVFQVGIALARPAPRVLAVAVTLATGDDAPVEVSVKYVAEFEVDAGVPEDERDRELRAAAFSAAPALLYPHLRETFINLSMRGRGRPVLLPMPTLDLSFAEEEMAIPPYNGG